MLTAPPGMDNCANLPVFRGDNMIISCWRPTVRERLSILVRGRVWLLIHSPDTQPPVAVQGRKTVFKKAREDRWIGWLVRFRGWIFRISKQLEKRRKSFEKPEETKPPTRQQRRQLQRALKGK
jgi:hypothetical protein